MDRLQALSLSIQARYAALSKGARIFLAFWAAFQLGVIALVWYITPKRIYEGARLDVRCKSATDVTVDSKLSQVGQTSLGIANSDGCW